MADKSAIEWTDTTWNPVVGCSIKSPGCKNCYAQRMAWRLSHNPATPHYAGTAEMTKAGPVFTGKLALAPDHIFTAPLRWKRTRKIFVNSMGDLFHEDVPDEWIDRVFAVMALCPQHTFQVLTKRAERMQRYSCDTNTPHRIARAIDMIQSTQASAPESILPILGYPGYFVSSHGFVYSERRGRRRRLKPDIGEQGHLRVPLYCGDKIYDRLFVHRLVLEAFVGPPPSPVSQGRHRDQNPTNNALANLRWGDQEANWDDSKRHGTYRRYSKLTPDQAAEIKRCFAAGELAAALGRAFDISDTQARNIGTGKQWAVAFPIEWPLPQIWLGVSTERQQEADERIPLLLQTPAVVRFISAEPLLGPIDLERGGFTFLRPIKSPSGTKWPGLNWIICGGESGPGARAMRVDWAADIIGQCQDAGVSVFCKQLGSNPRIVGERIGDTGFIATPKLRLVDRAGGDPEEWPKALRVRQFPATA
jgi:protein gp37